MHHDTKKSLLLGGIIGSVLTGLFMSKKGKEMRKQALLVASHLYKELDKKAEHLLELSQEKYEELVEVLVKEYAKKKNAQIDAIV